LWFGRPEAGAAKLGVGCLNAQVPMPDLSAVRLDRGVLGVLHWQAPITGETHIRLGVLASVDDGNQVLKRPMIGRPDEPSAFVAAAFASVEDTSSDPGRRNRIIILADP